jgi:putative endonuclease
MTSKQNLGKLGEDLACGYLVKKGYKILERNFWKPWGELDIIAKSPDKTLVFVEVKTVRQFGNKSGNESGNSELPDSEGIEPEMQMTAAKIKKLQRTASLYAGNHPELVNDDRGWRIDLLALTLRETSGSTINGKDCEVRHYENI